MGLLDRALRQLTQPLVNRLVSAWDGTKGEADGAVRRVRNAVAERQHGDEGAWGQYLDPPDYKEGYVGVYGTSSAIQMLLVDGDAGIDRTKRGVEWLVDQWADEDSDTVRRGHTYVLYKFAMFVVALAEHGDDLPDELLARSEHGDTHDEVLRGYCEELWERRQPWGPVEDGYGWGEFWYPDGEKPAPKVEATAMALFALGRCEAIRRDNDYNEALKTLGRKAKAEADRVQPDPLADRDVVVGLALTVLALTEYRDLRGSKNTTDIIKEHIADCAKKLETFVQYPMDIDPSTYYYNLFSTPGDESDISPEEHVYDRYFIYIIYPLIALALLEAGRPHTGRNWKALKEITDTYVDCVEESDIDAHCSSETNHASLVDQLWITRHLHAAANYDMTENRFYHVFLGYTSKRTWVQIAVVVAAVAGVVAANVLRTGDAGLFASTAASVLILLSATLFGEAGLVQWLLDRW
jgi:hypothetical protein